MKDETWEYDMWWDAINSMEEDYDDMDDWQPRSRGTSPFFIRIQKLRSFFVRLTYENSGLNLKISLAIFQI